MNLTLKEYKDLATKRYEIIPLSKELLADTETPVTIFLKLKEYGKSILLESVEQKEETGRYSFIGYQVETAAYYSEEKLFIKGQEKKYQKDSSTKSILHLLNEEFFTKKVYRTEGLPPFIGGMVGYLSYESFRFFDKINFNLEKKSALSIPDFYFFWVNTLVAVDSQKQKIQVITLTYPENNPEASYQNGIKKIEEVITHLRRDFKIPEKEIESEKEISLKSNIKKEDFYKKVEQAKEYIKSGDAFQIVLSQRFSAETQFSPFNIYRSLRAVNPSPYMYFLDYDDFQIIGASPEVMVKLDAEKNILLKPIAGTRPRGKTKEEDLFLEKELLNDEKEKAEHIMLVDLGRNDIGKIAIPGSVEVKELMKVERYSHVMHIVSTVTGKVEKKFSWADAIIATFPAGTVSGAPKIRAMEIIDQIEPDKRNSYAGAILYVSADGILDSCITIRTMIYKEGKVFVQAGAGIVYDSDPEKEYNETVNKVRALFSSIYKLKTDKIL